MYTCLRRCHTAEESTQWLTMQQLSRGCLLNSTFSRWPSRSSGALLLARRPSTQMHFQNGITSSCSTPGAPNKLAMCTDGLSLDAYRSKCISGA